MKGDQALVICMAIFCFGVFLMNIHEKYAIIMLVSGCAELYLGLLDVKL
jgi:hypothetical protein